MLIYAERRTMLYSFLYPLRQGLITAPRYRFRGLYKGCLSTSALEARPALGSTDMRILIATSDIMHAKMTSFLLTDSGNNVTHLAEEQAIYQELQKGKADLILLDDELDGCRGVELCQKIRGQYYIPIIYMFDDSPMNERVQALKFGADDVVAKPYNAYELLARIEAIMRRYGDGDLRTHTTYQPISSGPLNINPVQRSVVISGTREEPLTEREFQLLYYLVQNARCVLSARQLLQQVWGIEDVIDSNLVPVYIGRLRKKIEYRPEKPKHIVRVRDLGYSFYP
jgi:DNA-binding response OmpR family regulator